MGIDAELSLRKDNLAYVAELRVRESDDGDLLFGPFFVVIDPVELANLEQEPERYGQALSDALFQESGLVWVLGSIYGKAEARQEALRLRLFIDRSAPELDLLRWELLRIPGTTDCLSTSEQIHFSRYFPRQREAPPRQAAQMRALVAISNPKDIQKKYNRAPVSDIFNASFFRTALAGIQVDFLPSEEGEYCTLDLLARRAARHEVLVLMAHCARSPKGWTVLLQDATGKARPLLVEKLCARLQGARGLPRMLLLLGDDSAVSAPALMNEVGIPVVIGVHGPIHADITWLFVPALFEALREDGAVDRAVGAARRLIGDRCEEWAPVLYMNLSGGVLWQSLPAVEPAAPYRPFSPQAEPPPSAAQEPVKPPADAASAPAPQPDRAALYMLLGSPAFDLEGLEELCFFLRVEWDALGGQIQRTKARELIKYLESRGRLAELVDEIRKLRPDVRI